MTQAPNADVAPPSETKRLAEFVEALRQLLLEVMTRPRLLTPYADEFRSSWPANEARLRAIIQELSAPQSARNLQDHGLVGTELSLKLDLFYDARDEFESALTRLRWHPLRWLFGHPMPQEVAVDASDPLVAPPKSAPKAERLPRRALGWARGIAGKPARKMLVHALSIGDAVLESIGAAVPEAAVAAAGAGEFKQLVETVVDAARTRRRGKSTPDRTASESRGRDELLGSSE